MDSWVDWMVNPTWFPIQFNRILSILVSLLLLSSSPYFFYAVNNSYSIRLNQYPNSVSMIVVYYLCIDQWIHKCEYTPTNINPFEPFHCVTIKSNLLDYPKQPVCYQYWTNPNSIHHLGIIGRLESLSFVNVQYVIVGSLVITMMMIEMTGWLIESTILIQYQGKNGKEKQHNWEGRIDSLIIIESCIGIKNLFETNKHSINRNVPNQGLITEQFSIIDLLLDLMDKISENGRNIYEWNQINQTILEIDFDRTW